MLKLIIALLLFSNVSYGSGFVGLGAAARFVKDVESNFETKFPLLIYGGLKDAPWAYAVEALYLQDKSSSGSGFKITNDQYEATFYALRFLDYQEGRAINPYLVAGLGAFQSYVTTDFSGMVDKDKSKINPIVKLGAGAWSQLGSLGFINLEGKGMYSNDFSPELIFEISSRVGLEF